MGEHCESCPAKEECEHFARYNYSPTAKLQVALDIAQEDGRGTFGRSLFELATLQALGERWGEHADRIHPAKADEIVTIVIHAVHCHEECTKTITAPESAAHRAMSKAG